MWLALQLSNHDWHNHKLLIGPLKMFQKFCQTHQDIYAILGEDSYGHIKYSILY